jgi:cell division protein FtsQ
MMPLRINKKIIIYLSLFFLFVTVNNQILNKLSFPKINFIKIIGLNSEESQNLLKKLNYLKLQNLFFLDKNDIKKNINSNEIIDEFSIFKNYPSTLEIKIIKTQLIARTNKNGINYFIGSNGKLIKSDYIISNLPFIVGNFDNREFMNLKKIIVKSNFDFESIKKLYFYPSKRWDIETLDGLIIKLPTDDLNQSLNLLILLLDKYKSQDIKLIDLRQKNQVIINEK